MALCKLIFQQTQETIMFSTLYHHVLLFNFSNIKLFEQNKRVAIFQSNY